MSSSQSIALGGQTFHLQSLSGEVLSYNKHSETHVSGGGGYNNGPVRIRSRTTTYTECFLRDKQGKEHEVQFIDEDHIALREGHNISLVKAVLDDGSYYWCYLINHDTGNEHCLNHRNHSYRIERRWQWLMFAGSIVFLKFFLGWESWGLSLLYGLLLYLLLNFSLVRFYLRPKAIKALDKEVEDYINKHF